MAMQTHWQYVTEARAVKMFLSQEYILVLEQLMLKEWSVGQLAKELGLPLNGIHYRVRRLFEANLVVQTRVLKRQGRPVKYFRATSQAYLVPYSATPLNSLEELVGLYNNGFQERINQGIVEVGSKFVQDKNDIGMRLFVQDGQVYWDATPTAERFQYTDLLKPEIPAIFASCLMLYLDLEDAKNLQLELVELCQRYMNHQGEQRYLFQLGLAPENSKYTANSLMEKE